MKSPVTLTIGTDVIIRSKKWTCISIQNETTPGSVGEEEMLYRLESEGGIGMNLTDCDVSELIGKGAFKIINK